MMVGVGVAVGCLALQLWAYNASWLTAQHPRQCVVWGFGDCESIMASGYASIVPGQSVNFEAVVSRLMPLGMWIALALGAIRPNKWVVGGVGGLALLLSAAAFRRASTPQPVPVESFATGRDDRDLGRPCTDPAECSTGACMAFGVEGQFVPRGTTGATLRCTRPCQPTCPQGSRCTAIQLPTRGGSAVQLDACGPIVPIENTARP